MRLVLVFAALIGINLYIFVFKGGTSVRDLLHAAEAPPPVAAAIAPPRKAAPSRAPAPTVTVAGWSAEVDVSPHESLADALDRAGVPAHATVPLGAAIAKLVPKGAAPRLVVRFDGDGHPVSVDAELGDALCHVARAGERWHGERVPGTLATRVVPVGVTVATTLEDALRRRGETSDLALALAAPLAWDVALPYEAQPGDRVRALVEKVSLDGAFRRYGRVLAVEYAGHAGVARAFWYASPTVEGAWFDETGEAVARSLLRGPLAPVTLPDGVDRKHLRPAIRTDAGRRGVAWPAPAGTPVWAPADGRVVFRGARDEDGNVVVVEHAGGLEATVAHLDRFARGLEVGDLVRQKQLLGTASDGGAFVVVRIGGHVVDPARLRPARADAIAASKRAAFQKALAPRIDALGRIDAGKK